MSSVRRLAITWTNIACVNWTRRDIIHLKSKYNIFVCEISNVKFMLQFVKKFFLAYPGSAVWSPYWGSLGCSWTPHPHWQWGSITAGPPSARHDRHSNDGLRDGPSPPAWCYQGDSPGTDPCWYIQTWNTDPGLKYKGHGDNVAT